METLILMRLLLINASAFYSTVLTEIALISENVLNSTLFNKLSKIHFALTLKKKIKNHRIKKIKNTLILVTCDQKQRCPLINIHGVVSLNFTHVAHGARRSMRHWRRQVRARISPAEVGGPWCECVRNTITPFTTTILWGTVSYGVF